MRICYTATDVVIPHYRGASTHVYEVAKHLTRLGHEVHVISRRVSHVQPKYENVDSIHVHRIFRGLIAPLPLASYEQLKGTEQRIPKFLPKLYAWYLFTLHATYAGLITSAITKKYNVDVIVERESSFGAGAIASALTKRPLILEIIGPRYSRLSFKRSEKIIAYTRSVLHNFVPPNKLVFVTAAVDVKSFKPDLVEGNLIRERYGLRDSIVIGYVGTFASWHGIEELIEASIKVSERFPRVRFLMVGPYFTYAKELAQKRGVLNAYVFTGPIPYVDVPKYINAADILVAPYNPTKSELRRKYGIGSPLKVFEYMACGKPVITTAIEPITQVVHEGKTGILTTPGDSEALSEAIIHLIEKPIFAERLGKAAREEVEERYSWEAFALQLENILKEAIKGM